MALARWQQTITNAAGDVQPGATVEVRRDVPGQPLASLFSDRNGASPISNPFTADADGFAAFHVVGGAYKITVTKGSFTRTLRYVPIGTAAENDVDGLTAEVGVPFTFDTGTSDADPGAGALRLNHATPASATAIYVDNENKDASDVSSWLDTFDDGGKSTDRGVVHIFSIFSPGENYQLYRLTGSVVDGTGYRKLTVTHLNGAGAFLASAFLSVVFYGRGADPTGVDGSGNLTGVTGFIELAETSSPANPAADTLRVFAKDSGGVSKLYTRDSAGTETELGAGGSGIGRNLLTNSDGRIDQLNAGAAATTADDAYGSCDRWYSLTQTASITVQRLTAGEDGTPFYQQLKQTQASAQRMGRAQIVENADCSHLRGQSVVLSGRIRCSSSQPIRYAILEWTGTADAVTSDVVNSWTNGTFTAGQFFNSTTLNVLAVGSLTPPAATWADLTAITAACGSSMTNLIVMAWTEGTAAQNVTLDLRMKLEKGASATAWIPDATAAELTKCQRMVRKSYEQATVPGTATSTGQLSEVCGRTSTALPVHAEFNVPMRVTPTITIYNPSSGAAGTYRCTSGGTDQTLSSVAGISADRFTQLVATGNHTAAEIYTYQYVATCQL